LERCRTAASPRGGIAARVVLKLMDRQRVNVESADLPAPPIPL
jgi:hypothetical protein